MADREIKEFFDAKSAVRADEFAGSPVLRFEQERRRKALRALTPGTPCGRLLDLGCGNLLDLPALRDRAGQCFGADFSDAMLREGASRFPEMAGRLVVADACRLPFLPGSIDAIVASEVLEHVPGFEAVFDEAGSALREGGRLVVTTPNRKSLYGLARWWWERTRPWEHPYDRWKTRLELAAQYRRAGFTVTAARGACYLPALFGRAMPRWVQRLLVVLVAPLEPVLARLLPGCGYIVALSGTRGRG